MWAKYKRMNASYEKWQYILMTDGNNNNQADEYRESNISLQLLNELREGYHVDRNLTAHNEENFNK